MHECALMPSRCVVVMATQRILRSFFAPPPTPSSQNRAELQKGNGPRGASRQNKSTLVDHMLLAMLSFSVVRVVSLLLLMGFVVFGLPVVAGVCKELARTFLPLPAHGGTFPPPPTYTSHFLSFKDDVLIVPSRIPCHIKNKCCLPLLSFSSFPPLLPLPS